MEYLRSEAAEKKAVYFLYLAFAHLRYFNESINRFLSEKPALSLSEYDERLKQLMLFLQPQFQLVTDTFAYLYEQSNSEFGSAIGSAIGGAIGRVFVSAIGREFGRVYVSEFVSEFGSHILTAEWAWLIWIGYYEKCIPKCVTSGYFQTIPAFHFHHYIEEAKTLFTIIDKTELLVLYENLEDMCSRLPFSNHLSVTEMRLKNNTLVCSLVRENRVKQTIAEAEKGSLAAYYRQLGENQRSLFCPASYMNLGMDYIFLPVSYGGETFFPRNLYLFLPRSIEKVNFFNFIGQHRQKPIDEIVGAVMRAEDTVNIIQYIYLRRRDDSVAHEAIRAEYRRFLMEFVAARLEGGQDTSAETTENR